MKPPAIKIEIVHIDGPLKGTIQELHDPVITIGRHPDCHVAFPKESNTISRHHAEIRREGNRFLAIDQSTNGTLVNGKPITQCFLKNGDVLTISEDGPKISFLTTVLEDSETTVDVEGPSEQNQPPPQPQLQSPIDIEPLQARNYYPEEPFKDTPPPLEPQPMVPREPEAAEAYDHEVQTLQKPFIIQFGVMIKSFDTLPIVLGSAPESDFVINHPGVRGQHARIFYRSPNYHIKDLTGHRLIAINGRPIGEEAPMPPDTCIALSAQGPQFQFLGEGRLAEIDGSPPDQQASLGDETDKRQGKKGKSLWPFSKK